MKTLRLLAISAMVVIAVLMGIKSTSHALTLGFIDSANPVFYVPDNDPQDANPLVGVITYNGPIGADWIVNVTTGISKPILGSADHPQMDLNSVNLTSSGGGQLVLGLVDSGFTGPISGGIAGGFNFIVGGTTGGEVLFAAFGDPLNSELLLPGILIASLGPYSVGPFSGATGGSFPAGLGPFSLGILAGITHTGPAATSFDANLSGKVPEPISLILLGSGLAGAGLYRRFRKPRG